MVHGSSHRHAVRCGSPALEAELLRVGMETKRLCELLRAVMAKYTKVLANEPTP